MWQFYLGNIYCGVNYSIYELTLSLSIIIHFQSLISFNTYQNQIYLFQKDFVLVCKYR